jgi:putative DNA primase/helicase
VQPRSDYRRIFTLARQRGWNTTSTPDAFNIVPERLAPVSEQHTESKSAETAETAVDVAPPPLPEKPVVRLVAGEFSNILRQLEEIIEPDIYTQGPALVRPTEAHSDKEIQRSSDAIMLCEATKAWAKKRFGDLATFQRYAKTKVGGNWYTVDASAEHINALLELGNWTVLRPLDAVARSPFVRTDGSICDVRGYDRRARVLYVPSAAYPGIPAVPDQDSARAALGRIRRVFHQFPWKEPASESAFVSHILTEAARLAIDTCPMFFYTAPSAGAGKTTLSRVPSAIVHGSLPAIRSWVSDGDELRKVLFAALLAGDRSLLFDNVPSGFKTRAAELCGFITTDFYSGRKLGESKSYEVPNKAVLSATGNNITPVGDMARRSIVIRLVPTQNQADRRFEIEEPLMYVMANRPQLLVDALTIIKAYHGLAQKPEMPAPFSSFVQWSHTVREPLIWLGLADPCDTKNETDDETQSLGAVFEALAGHFGDREFTSNDLARMVGGLLDTNGDLLTALQQSGCSDPTSPAKVGYWLRNERDKISDGWQLVNRTAGGHTVRWKFVHVEEPPT